MPTLLFPDTQNPLLAPSPETPPPTLRRIIAVLERHSIKLKDDIGLHPALHISPPSTSPFDLEKTDGSVHLLVAHSRDPGDVYILTLYNKGWYADTGGELISPIQGISASASTEIYSFPPSWFHRAVSWDEVDRYLNWKHKELLSLADAETPNDPTETAYRPRSGWRGESE